MKILTFDGKQIDCKPTQEAIEKEGISTYNRVLKIKENTGFLVPAAIKYGGGWALDDEIVKINKINMFNIFKTLKTLKNNQELLDFKIKEQERINNYELPIEIIK